MHLLVDSPCLRFSVSTTSVSMTQDVLASFSKTANVCFSQILKHRAQDKPMVKPDIYTWLQQAKVTRCDDGLGGCKEKVCFPCCMAPSTVLHLYGIDFKGL